MLRGSHYKQVTKCEKAAERPGCTRATPVLPWSKSGIGLLISISKSRRFPTQEVGYLQFD